MPRVKYKISEPRILQILNDIAEDMGDYKKSELVEVVKYQTDSVMDECGKLVMLKGRLTIGVFEYANKIMEAVKAY